MRFCYSNHVWILLQIILFHGLWCPLPFHLPDTPVSDEVNNRLYRTETPDPQMSRFAIFSVGVRKRFISSEIRVDPIKGSSKKIEAAFPAQPQNHAFDLE